jgi:DNA-binding MarR family transcriptional regulator
MGLRHSCDDFMGYGLKRASLRFGAEFDRELSGLGLSPVLFTLLLLVAQSPGVTSSQLGQQLEIQSSNMVGLIRQMKARGWIEATDHPQDRRARGLHLTPQGTAFLAQAEAAAMRSDLQASHALTPEERTQLLRLLRKVWQA